MSLDPNLEKMKNVYLNDIKRGWTTRAMHEARDYLSYIHNDNLLLINKEMDQFANYLRETKRQLDNQKKVKNASQRV